jgi:hypothetical protein
MVSDVTIHRPVLDRTFVENEKVAVSSTEPRSY